MSERTIGIEITSSQIKLLEMDASTIPPRVFRFSFINLLTPHPENISQQMRAALSYINPGTKKARMAISDSSLHHLIPLPPMPAKEMRVVVERELKEASTVPLPEMALGYQIIGEEGVKKIVLAAAAPSTLVSEKACFLRDLHLIPELITTVPIALFHCLRLMEGANQGLVGHIHLGDEKGHVLILRDGRWAFHREFPRSPSPEEDVSEIHRSLLYFRQQLSEEEIGKVFLSGTGTEGLEKELRETLKVEVEPFLPPLDLSPLKERVNEFRQILPEFAIPLGLSGMRAKDTLTLLGPRAVRRGYGAILKKAAIAGVVVSTLTIGVGYAWLSKEISICNKILQEKRRDLKRPEPYLAAQKERELYRKHLALLRDFNYHLLWTELLRELSLLAPPEMAFQSLTVKREGDKIRVAIKGEVFIPKGSSVDQGVFNRFYSQMVSSPFFARVEVDPGSVKISQLGGSQRDELVRQEFEVRGEVKALDFEYEKP
jgi:Tfp pilus assembly PilM family ATPase